MKSPNKNLYRFLANGGECENSPEKAAQILGINQHFVGLLVRKGELSFFLKTEEIDVLRGKPSKTLLKIWATMERRELRRLNFSRMYNERKKSNVK